MGEHAAIAVAAVARIAQRDGAADHQLLERRLGPAGQRLVLVRQRDPDKDHDAAVGQHQPATRLHRSHRDSLAGVEIRHRGGGRG
jgi:hypothetical protein